MLSITITRDQADQIQALQGPERNAAGKPFVSPELLTLINIPRADGKTFSNVQVRGMAPIGMEIRPGVKIIDGRMFNPATNEAIAHVATGRPKGKVVIKLV